MLHVQFSFMSVVAQSSNHRPGWLRAGFDYEILIIKIENSSQMLALPEPTWLEGGL